MASGVDDWMCRLIGRALWVLGLACAAEALASDPATPAASGDVVKSQAPAAAVPAAAQPGPAASPGKLLLHETAATLSLMTLESTPKGGSGKTKPYSDLNYGLSVAATLWPEILAPKAGLKVFANAQSLAFDASKDGRMAATELTTYKYGVAILVEPLAGYTIGTLFGSTTTPLVVEPVGGTVEIAAAEAYFYGVAFGYSHRLGEAWIAGGSLEQIFTGSSKLDGIAVEEGASYCLSLALERAISPHSHVTLEYRLAQARQDTAQAQLDRGEDMIAVGYGAAVNW